MNLYIELEVTLREFESRLLLAFEAANKSFNVFIAYRKDIQDSALKSKISPGIIHMKDANCTKDQLEIYKKLKKLGFIITSQDEEGGYIPDDYSKHFDGRMPNGMSFDFIDYFFCWGIREKKFLSEKLPEFKEKFIETGSPRFDLFNNNYVKEDKNNFYKKYNLSKKYVLISGVSYPLAHRRLADRFIINFEVAFKDEKEQHEKNFYNIEAESLLFTHEFIKLIRFLSNELTDYEIVLRPHPNTLSSDWVKLLGKDCKAKIISDGNLADFIVNSEILVQRNCSSALESRILGKKSITFLPNVLLPNDKVFNFVNEFGEKAQNKEEVLNKIKNINNIKLKDINETDIDQRISFAFGDKLSFPLILECWCNIKKSYTKNIHNLGFKKNYLLILKQNIKNFIKKLILKRLNNQSNHNLHDIKFTDFNIKYINECKSKFKKYYDLNYLENIKVTIIENKILNICKKK